MLRFHIVFKGLVQGVGFRFTARKIACKYGLSGWIRNNPDGTVETVVEGRSVNLRIFLQELRESFRGYIQDCIVDEKESDKEFSDYSIVY